MRRIGPIIALSLLVFAAPAAAKGVGQASVCGASGCTEVTDERLLVALSDAGTPSDPPAEGAPWYRADLTFHGGEAEERFAFVIVPSVQKLRGEDGTWMSMLPQHVSRYHEMTNRVEPFPAATLAGLDGPRVPRVRVHEVVRAEDLIAAHDGGGFPREWVAGGVAAALLAAGVFLALRRRSRPGPAAPPAAEPTT